MPGTEPQMRQTVARLIERSPKNVTKGSSATGSLLQRVRHLASSNQPLQPLPPLLLQDDRLDHELWDGIGTKYQSGMFAIPEGAKFHGSLMLDDHVASVYSTTTTAILIVHNPCLAKLEAALWDRNEIDQRFETRPPWNPSNQRSLPVDQLPDFLRRGGLSHYLERKGPLPWLALHNIVHAADIHRLLLRPPDCPLPSGKLFLKTIFQRSKTIHDSRSMARNATLQTIAQAQSKMESLLMSIKQLVLQHAQDDPDRELHAPSSPSSALQPAPCDTVLARRPEMAVPRNPGQSSPTLSSSTDETVDCDMLGAPPRSSVPLLCDLVCGLERPQVANLSAPAHTAILEVIRHLFGSQTQEAADSADGHLARRLVESKFTDSRVCLFDMLLYLGSLLQRGSCLVLVDVSSDVGVIGRVVMVSSSGVAPLDVDLAHRMLRLANATTVILEACDFSVTAPIVPNVNRLRLKLDQRRQDQMVSAAVHGSRMTIEHDVSQSLVVGPPSVVSALSRVDASTLLQRVSETAQTATAQAVHALVGPNSEIDKQIDRQVQAALDRIPSTIQAALQAALASVALPVIAAAPQATAPPETASANSSPREPASSATRDDAKRSCDNVWDSVRRLKAKLDPER